MAGYSYPLYDIPQYPGMANFPTPSASVAGPTANVIIDQNTGIMYSWDFASSVWRLIASPAGTASGYTTTATAAGTTTLTYQSTSWQFFTGSTTQTVKLPVTSTLILGQQFYVVNNSTGNVTVQSSGANTIQVLVPGQIGIYTCISLSGTGTSSWQQSLGPIAQGYAGLPTGAGQYLGTNTNDNASAGNIGEYIENNCPSGSAVSVTSGTITDADSGGGVPVGITLTAGDWDIEAVGVFLPAGTTTVTVLSTWVGTASGNVTTGRDLARNTSSFAQASAAPGNNPIALTIPRYRVSIASTTTYYLKISATFATSTLTAYGTLAARRVR